MQHSNTPTYMTQFIGGLIVHKINVLQYYTDYNDAITVADSDNCEKERRSQNTPEYTRLKTFTSDHCSFQD